MRKIKNLIFTLFISVVACSGIQGKAEENNQKQEQGFFPITPWCSYYKSSLQGIKDCNFTVAGFFVDPEDLDYCQELGLKAVLYPGLPRNYEKLAQMTDADIEKTIKGFVLKTKDHPAVYGYYVISWPNEKAFHAIAIAVKAIKKYAPGKIAYMNHFASWANEYCKSIGKPKDKWVYQEGTYIDFLERYVKEVKPNMLSWDNYRILESNDMADKSIVRNYFEGYPMIESKASDYYKNLIIVRGVALENSIPFWNFIGCCSRGAWIAPSYANMSLQAFTSLAAGARGISWFRYFDGSHAYAPVYRANRESKTIVWSWLKEINHQVLTLAPVMLKLNSKGIYFTLPVPAEACLRLPGEIVKNIESDHPMMVGEFKHEDGTDYIMLVNLSLERTVKFSLMTQKEYAQVDIVSSIDGSLRPFYGKAVKGKNPYEKSRYLQAGQGMLIKMRDR